MLKKYFVFFYCKNADGRISHGNTEVEISAIRNEADIRLIEAEIGKMNAVTNVCISNFIPFE